MTCLLSEFIGEKGGTGKTTTAIQLACRICARREAVALIDIDPQANAANWGDRRGPGNPVVVSGQASRFRQTLDLAQAADIAMIDSPGHNNSAAPQPPDVPILVLIPSRPKVFDLETLEAVRDLLRVADDPPAFVLLNGLHPAATHAAAEAKAMIDS